MGVAPGFLTAATASSNAGQRLLILALFVENASVDERRHGEPRIGLLRKGGLLRVRRPRLAAPGQCAPPAHAPLRVTGRPGILARRDHRGFQRARARRAEPALLQQHLGRPEISVGLGRFELDDVPIGVERHVVTVQQQRDARQIVPDFSDARVRHAGRAEAAESRRTTCAPPRAPSRGDSVRGSPHCPWDRQAALPARAGTAAESPSRRAS